MFKTFYFCACCFALLAKAAEAPDSIFDAARRGDTALVAEMLAGDPALVNARNAGGETPLHAAAANFDPQTALLLISKGADVNARDNQLESTPLMIAAYIGCPETAQALIAAGADVNAASSHGTTALHLAAYQGHEALVRLLLESGADKDARTSAGMTPAGWAEKAGNPQISGLLTAAGEPGPAPSESQAQVIISLQDEMSEMRRWGALIESNLLGVQHSMQSEREAVRNELESLKRTTTAAEQRVAALDRHILSQDAEIESLKTQLDVAVQSLSDLAEEQSMRSSAPPPARDSRLPPEMAEKIAFLELFIDEVAERLGKMELSASQSAAASDPPVPAVFNGPVFDDVTPGEPAAPEIEAPAPVPDDPAADESSGIDAAPPDEGKEDADTEPDMGALSELYSPVLKSPAAGDIFTGPDTSGRYGDEGPWWVCALHVHTRFSSGHYGLPELSRIAGDQGVDAVFLSDSWVESVQYGLPPLRHVLWLRRQNPSVSRMGVSRYISLVEAENARQSAVLYVPGIELVPEIHWTGGLLERKLTCRNHQKNLVVLGIRDDGTAEKLPVANGYVPGRDSAWVFFTRLVLIATLLIGAVFAVLLRPLSLRSGIPARVIVRSFVLVFLVPAAILMGLMNFAASRVPHFNIYEQPAGFQQDQRVLDALAGSNLACFWAHPEAPDYHEYSMAGIGLTLKTDPYTDALLKTAGYTGFAGLNEGENNLIMPGGMWDKLLDEYQNGLRRNAPWCFGENLYHYEGQAGKRLSNVQTVVRSPDRTRDNLLASLKKGAFYARRSHEGRALTLNSWRLAGAASGETVHIAGKEVEAALSVAGSGQDAEVELVIIRNGETIFSEKSALPFDFFFADTLPDGVDRAYYRALVLDKYPVKLATNPIFVRRGP